MFCCSNIRAETLAYGFKAFTDRCTAFAGGEKLRFGPALFDCDKAQLKAYYAAFGEDAQALFCSVHGESSIVARRGFMLCPIPWPSRI